jgi:uncharacterized membrane protein YbhN (UPF0104 family)
MTMAGATIGTRRGWTSWARLVLSVGILVFLIHKAKLGQELRQAFQSDTVGYLVLGFVVTLIGFVLSAWRWQRVLIVFERPVRLARLVTHYLAGQFIGAFLPMSTVTGDALRVWRLAGDTGSSELSFASVALERLTGWLVLPVLALLGLALNPAMRHLGAATALLVFVAVGTLVLLGAVLWVTGHPRLAGRFAQRASWTRFIGALHVGIDNMRRHPSAAAGVLGASFVYQLTTVLAFALAIRVVDLHVPLTAVLAFAPVVAILQVASPLQSGLGFREGALYLFLHQLVGAQGDVATGAGLIFFTMVTCANLLGAPAFVRNRPHVQVSR